MYAVLLLAEPDLGTAIALVLMLGAMLLVAGTPARVLGLAIGAASQIVPVYIAELAPAARRGGLVVLFQLAVVSGILLSSIVGWLLGPVPLALTTTAVVVVMWRRQFASVSSKAFAADIDTIIKR